MRRRWDGEFAARFRKLGNSILDANTAETEDQKLAIERAPRSRGQATIMQRIAPGDHR
jgi:hypothetical protein